MRQTVAGLPIEAMLALVAAGAWWITTAKNAHGTPPLAAATIKPAGRVAAAAAAAAAYTKPHAAGPVARAEQSPSDASPGPGPACAAAAPLTKRQQRRRNKRANQATKAGGPQAYAGGAAAGLPAAKGPAADLAFQGSLFGPGSLFGQDQDSWGDIAAAGEGIDWGEVRRASQEARRQRTESECKSASASESETRDGISTAAA